MKLWSKIFGKKSEHKPAAPSTQPQAIAQYAPRIKAAPVIPRSAAELKSPAEVAPWITSQWEIAVRSSGGCWELCQRLYSEAIDKGVALASEENAKQIIAQAGEEYLTPHQRQEVIDCLEKEGRCTRTGLDPECCPCGCGDLD